MDLVFVSFDYAAKHWNELCGASTEAHFARKVRGQKIIANFAAKHFNVLCGEAL